MAETKDTLTDVINASGFLFQLKLEQEIKASRPLSNLGEWQLIAKEHRWLDPLDGKEGFIDLVLEAGSCRIVIECKRVTDASWVFLCRLKRKRLNADNYYGLKVKTHPIGIISTSIHHHLNHRFA